jgi:hypothetical protein
MPSNAGFHKKKACQRAVALPPNRASSHIVDIGMRHDGHSEKAFTTFWPQGCQKRLPTFILARA